MTNKEKYINLCKMKKVALFNQHWWLDAVCGETNWDVSIVEKGGNIFAAMPFFKNKKFIFDIINLPKLTQNIDIYFNYPKNQKYYKKLSFEKEMIEKILLQIPHFDMHEQSFSYKTTNLLPFYWANYKLSIGYTYIIKDIDLDTFEKNLETDIRRRNKKAKNLGIEIYEDDNINEFYRINEMTFKRQGRNIPYTLEFIKNLYRTCKEKNSVKVYFAKYENSIIASNFLVYDENTVYYLMGGVDTNSRDLGGMDVLLLESIKFALNTNRTFDFEGSMVPSIEKYFRSFGSMQKPYYIVSKTNSKILKFRNFISDIQK